MQLQFTLSWHFKPSQLTMKFPDTLFQCEKGIKIIYLFNFYSRKRPRVSRGKRVILIHTRFRFFRQTPLALFATRNSETATAWDWFHNGTNLLQILRNKLKKGKIKIYDRKTKNNLFLKQIQLTKLNMKN